MRLTEIQVLGSSKFMGTNKDLDSLFSNHYTDYHPINDEFSYTVFKNKIQMIHTETDEQVGVLTFKSKVVRELPNFSWEDKVIISSNYRGQGIGKLLYNIAINKAKLSIISDTRHTVGTIGLWASLSKTFTVNGFILNTTKLYEFEKALKNKEDQKELLSLVKHIPDGQLLTLQSAKRYIMPLLDRIGVTVKSGHFIFPVHAVNSKLDNEFINVYSRLDLGIHLILTK